MVFTWNGVSILAPLKAKAPDHIITSDASGSWGSGAFHANEWFQMEWDSHTTPLHITIKELFPVVIATAIWGRNWVGKTLCNNMAVVHIIRTQQSKDHNAMHLMRCLALIECSFHFTLADALSRNNLHHFLAHYPQTQPTPTPINLALQSPHLPATQLDLDHLGRSVREYYIQGLPPSTTRTYNSVKTRFITFCSSCNQSPIPVSENLICYYVGHLANKGLAHSTIKTYLSAVRTSKFLVATRIPTLETCLAGHERHQIAASQTRASIPTPPTNHAHNSSPTKASMGQFSLQL